MKKLTTAEYKKQTEKRDKTLEKHLIRAYEQKRREYILGGKKGYKC